MASEEDLRVLRACLEGQRDDFVRHFRPLIAGALRDMGSRDGTEDLCQEVFLALFEHDARRLRQFDPAKGAAASWLGMIARQVALKRLERAEAGPFPDAAAGQAPSPAEQADRRERIARLREALKGLPSREALCLALLVDQGLPAGRVAAILRVSRQTVYEIKDRALGRLREALKEF